MRRNSFKNFYTRTNLLPWPSTRHLNMSTMYYRLSMLIFIHMAIRYFSINRNKRQVFHLSFIFEYLIEHRCQRQTNSTALWQTRWPHRQLPIFVYTLFHDHPTWYLCPSTDSIRENIFCMFALLLISFSSYNSRDWSLLVYLPFRTES